MPGGARACVGCRWHSPLAVLAHARLVQVVALDHLVLNLLAHDADDGFHGRAVGRREGRLVRRFVSSRGAAVAPRRRGTGARAGRRAFYRQLLPREAALQRCQGGAAAKRQVQAASKRLVSGTPHVSCCAMSAQRHGPGGLIASREEGGGPQEQRPVHARCGLSQRGARRRCGYIRVALRTGESACS